MRLVASECAKQYNEFRESNEFKAISKHDIDMLWNNQIKMMQMGLA